MSNAKEIADRLNRQEETTTVGVNVLTPKQHLLDARSVEAKMPEKHVRWVSLRDPSKIDGRKAEGYEIISNEQGGRRLGDESVLMAQPRERYEAKIAAQQEMNRQRLVMHRGEMERAVESVVKTMRDRYGINVETNRILVQEG